MLLTYMLYMHVRSTGAVAVNEIELAAYGIM